MTNKTTDACGHKGHFTPEEAQRCANGTIQQAPAQLAYAEQQKAKLCGAMVYGHHWDGICALPTGHEGQHHD